VFPQIFYLLKGLTDIKGGLLTPRRRIPAFTYAPDAIKELWQGIENRGFQIKGSKLKKYRPILIYKDLG